MDRVFIYFRTLISSVVLAKLDLIRMLAFTLDSETINFLLQLGPVTNAAATSCNVTNVFEYGQYWHTSPHTYHAEELHSPLYTDQCCACTPRQMGVGNM
jgi:hypothetical protein